MATAFKADFGVAEPCMVPALNGAVIDGAGTKLWYSAAELAALALPGLPGTKRKINEYAKLNLWGERLGTGGMALARPRAGRGGGIEFHIDVLPPAARFKLAQDSAQGNAVRAANDIEAEATEANWHWYEAQPDHVKAEAKRREMILASVSGYIAAGVSRSMAVKAASEKHEISASSIWGWLKLVKGIGAEDMLVYLAPRRQGGGRPADIHADIWRFFLSMYLAPERRCIANCYRRADQYARGNGLPVPLPHVRTFQRKLERDVDPAVIAKTRGGRDALDRTMPSQKRSVAGLHAMELLNVDGHRFDVFVRFPNGQIDRPTMVAIQDVYSRKMLGWRFDVSENVTVTRLAFADVFRDHGIPKAVLLDNGRAFASKQITGGAPTRFRFKVIEGEPTGILPALGINPLWATPYHGQAKPIERQFRDFCEDIAKHPAFAGAWTGNNPMAKPENYQSKAVDFDVFCRIVSEEIHRNNARAGRQTEMAGGTLSFDQVFEASYAVAPIGKATDAQLRLALLSSETLRVQRDGSIRFAGNQYWSAELSAMPGARVMIRFDPDDLHSEIHVYAQDDRFLMTVPVWAAEGFRSQEASKRIAKVRSDYRKAAKKKEEALDLLDAATMAELLDKTPKPEAPTQAPSVTRIVQYRGNAARKVEVLTEPSAPAESAVKPSFIDQFAAVTERLRLVE